MTVLMLRLAGPLQAWGDSSRFTRRDSRHEPTKSGVLGLLAAAEGRSREDDLTDLAGLRFGVRVDQPGRLERDFQTAIRHSDGKPMPLSYRYYLADAVFLAAVEGPSELLGALDAALRRPAYPLYLGRRACPTEGQVTLGLAETDLETTLRGQPWLASEWHRREQAKRVLLPVVMDAAPGAEATETVRDVPVSFSSLRREYVWREVCRPAPVAVDNPHGHDRPDFLAVLGGA